MNQPSSSSQSSTERLQSPEAIRLALAAYDASLNSIISMVTIRDSQGKIIDFLMQTANQAVERSLSILPDQLIGKPMLDLFPGSVSAGLSALYEWVVETGQAEQTTIYYPMP